MEPEAPELPPHLVVDVQTTTTVVGVLQNDSESEGLSEEVLRYLCESNDAVLNLTTVDFFANVLVSDDVWPDLDWHTIAKITFIGKVIIK